MRRLLLAALACLAWGGVALAQSNDFSGLITVGGTSQVAIAAKPAGQVVFVQNASVETETLWVNFGAAAAAAVANTSGESIGLLPGGSISLSTTQSVNVVASDTGHVFVAKTLPAAEVSNPAETVTSTISGSVTLASQGYSASAAYTPAATSHVANDVNGGAQTIALSGPASGRLIFTCASLMINGATAEASAWRIYLYDVTPPSATADDGAWDLPSGDQASFQGYIDLGTAVDLGSTQWVETCGINKQVKLQASGNLFGYLVNLTTLTPAAVAHTVTLRAVAP